MAAIASEPNLNSLDNLISNPVEFHAPQAYFKALPTQQPPLDMEFVQEPLYGLNAAMEMEPEIEADLCKIYPFMFVT